MADLHLATINGEPTVSIGFDRDEMMAASFIALGESILAGKLSVEQAIVVADPTPSKDCEKGRGATDAPLLSVPAHRSWTRRSSTA
jgi:hypothetical protein